MIFSPDNREDISRYYKGTYVKFKETGDELYLIEGVDHTKVYGRHESGDPFYLWMNEETPYSVDYILPHKSYFQYGENACLLQRNPAKQFYRGLCTANTNMAFLGTTGVVKGVPLNFEVLKAFVQKQKFFNLAGAISATDKATCALSSRMMYHRSNKHIYIDTMPVARVNPGKLQVSVIKHIFFDEVWEWMKLSGDALNFKVEKFVPPPPKKKDDATTLLKEMGLPKMKKAPDMFGIGAGEEME